MICVDQMLQFVYQSPKLREVPFRHRCFPGVPEGFAAEPGHFAEASQIKPKLED